VVSAAVKFHGPPLILERTLEAITRSFAFFVAFLASALPAYAYLDPVTGSLVVQGLIALIAGALAGVKSVRARLLVLIYALLGRKRK